MYEKYNSQTKKLVINDYINLQSNNSLSTIKYLEIVNCFVQNQIVTNHYESRSTDLLCCRFDSAFS